MGHQRKRQVEVRVMEWAEEEGLFDSDLPEEEIQERIQKKREQLLKNIDKIELKVTNETHSMALAKEAENKKVAKALGIDNKYSEGTAFDQELQEQKRLQRQAELHEAARQQMLQELAEEEKQLKEKERLKKARERREASLSPGEREEEGVSEEERKNAREKRRNARSDRNNAMDVDDDASDGSKRS